MTISEYNKRYNLRWSKFAVMTAIYNLICMAIAGSPFFFVLQGIMYLFAIFFAVGFYERAQK